MGYANFAYFNMIYGIRVWLKILNKKREYDD